MKFILQNGFRFSYAFEHVDTDVILYDLNPSGNTISERERESYKDCGVSIPMVCFCDIPLLRTSEHTANYGDFAIGIDKDILIKFYSIIMNPVFYISSENVKQMINDFSKRKTKAISEIIEYCEKIDINDISNIDSIMEHFSSAKYMDHFRPLINEKISTNFLIGLSKPYGIIENGKFKCFFDEREWRAILVDNSYSWANWKWGITQQEHNKHREFWNQEIGSHDKGFMTIPKSYLRQAITHLIVEKESQRDELIDMVMSSKTILGNNNISKKDRLFIVSKITSRERISVDY